MSVFSHVKDHLVQLKNSDEWRFIVEYAKKRREEAYRDLANPNNLRDDDQLLKGSIAEMTEVFGLDEDDPNCIIDLILHEFEDGGKE